MNWYRRFIAGRYGADHLSIALMLLSLLLMIAASLSGWVVFSILSLAPMAWCFSRLLSRDIARRRAENEGLLRWARGLTSRLRRIVRRIAGIRTHRYFRCPQCGIALRAPRGKGKIRVSCSKCGNRFETKT